MIGGALCRVRLVEAPHRTGSRPPGAMNRDLHRPLADRAAEPPQVVDRGVTDSPVVVGNAAGQLQLPELALRPGRIVDQSPAPVGVGLLVLALSKGNVDALLVQLRIELAATRTPAPPRCPRQG